MLPKITNAKTKMAHRADITDSRIISVPNAGRLVAALFLPP